ncbi:Tudor domain-containing protein 1, partial [Stegodyphus mimosarum]
MAQFRHTARELLITYVKSDGNLLKFWALPATALEVVKNLENHYAKVAGELDKMSVYIRNTQTPVGMKLSVKSKIKRQWCRARVLSHSGHSDILVQLMDYGNEENISVTDARRMEDRLLSIEPQAIECILADVVPPGTSEWPPEAIKFCESHLSYQTLSCYVVSSYLSIPVVRVAKGGESEPFVQRLINSGLALIKQEQPVAVPPAVSYKVNTMDPKTAHLVKVSHVESIRKFYVQLSAAEVELQRLMDAIQKYVAQESLALLNVPLVSAACLAESDHLYRRARILAVLQGKCQIFYVDYGYTETKEFQELRAIPQYFMTLPAQAICCSLSSDDREEMRLVTKGYHLQCFVLGYNGDKCIVSLRRHGQDIVAPRRISPQMTVYSVTYRKQKLNLGSSIEVTVSSITDITEFYCQLLCFKDQQEAIAFKLNSGYIFEALHINECIPGQAICVKFHNKIWYRAEILKVNHEQDIEVFFVDIGNYEKVSLANIRKVNSELLNFPCQAYKCCLYETGNILNGVPKEEVLSLFQELTLGKNLKAQVQAFTEDNSYVITLYEMDSNISVFQKMESKILTASTVPVSDVENLFITSFTSPSLFFAQFEKLDSNLLSEMQEQINELYQGNATFSKRNLKYVPTVGNLVCAKYEEDNQFYRALVISFKDSQFEVFFIDYGNRCIVPLYDIHPITKEFIKFPAFGIECSLESYPPGTPVDKLCSLMLENSIQARMIAEKDNKWLITLTDDFPNNVAILELLRQHENVVPRPIHGIGGFQENRTRKGSKYQPKINERDEIQPRLDMKQSYKKEQVSRNQMPRESESIVKTKESKVFQNYDVIEIPPNAYRNVYVSHVVSPSEFYCQIEEDSPKLLVLMKDIEDMYTFLNDNDLKLSTFVLNSPCCAVFQEDGVWYRGQIRKINSNSCDIYFVDYGNTDTVPSSKIKMLKTELLSLPPQAIRCKSFNIVPKTGSWSDADIEAFQAMTLDKSFVAQFVEQDDHGVYSVNLVSIGKLQEDVLNKEFVDLGHGQLADSSKILVLNSHAASSNLTYKSLDVKIGSTEPVKVTYGLNPGEIFCQLKCYNKEFETMMLNLQDYYNKVNKAEALVDRPHPGMICVAQFFLDCAWYRAEIKKVEKTTIVVFYVDYGNCETVDRKKIRCILQDFTLLPTQAVRC